MPQVGLWVETVHEAREEISRRLWRVGSCAVTRWQVREASNEGSGLQLALCILVSKISASSSPSSPSGSSTISWSVAAVGVSSAILEAIEDSIISKANLCDRKLP